MSSLRAIWRNASSVYVGVDIRGLSSVSRGPGPTLSPPTAPAIGPPTGGGRAGASARPAPPRVVARGPREGGVPPRGKAGPHPYTSGASLPLYHRRDHVSE